MDVTERTAAERALANIVYEHYDLGEIKRLHAVPLVHQRRHRKYLIESEGGKFLAKTYKAEPQILDALRFQHRLSAHLDENGLPVARIQPAFSGNKIVQMDDWALELQEWIEAESMRITGRSLIASADALGRFHLVCRDFPCPERDSRIWRFSEVPRDMFAQLYDMAKRERPSRDTDAACNTVALFLRESANEINFDARDRFETGLIHGDWHGANLLFRGDQLAAIIDLEFAGDGCYLEDISYAVSNLCVRTMTESVKLHQRVDLLLAYYSRHRTLAPSEERSLYYAVGIKHVATVCYQCIQMNGAVAGHTPAQWLAILADQTEWLNERAHAVKKGW
jgi:Ser/Thr protein kinase RdoA (MazF antagonist)